MNGPKTETKEQTQVDESYNQSILNELQELLNDKEDYRLG